MAIIFSIIGVLLLVSSCAAYMEAKSAIHQIFGAVQFMTGMLMLAVAALLHAVAGVRQAIEGKRAGEGEPTRSERTHEKDVSDASSYLG